MALMLPLLAALTGATQPGVSEPLEPPVLSAELSLRQEANGQCAEVDAGLSGRPPLIHMTDVCHGWSTHACAAILLIKAQGVGEDAGEVLFLRENRSADLVPLVDAEIERIWPGNEHLHLALTDVRCVEGGMVISFVGSRVRKRASASAHGITGTLTFLSANQIKTRINPAR